MPFVVMSIPISLVDHSDKVRNILCFDLVKQFLPPIRNMHYLPLNPKMVHLIKLQTKKENGKKNKIRQ